MKPSHGTTSIGPNDRRMGRILARVTLLIAVAGIVAACDVFSSTPQEARLIGTWQWVSSTGGIGGWTITPDSSGYSPRRRVYFPDGRYQIFHADTVFVWGHYSVEHTDERTLVTYDLDEDAPDGFFADQYVQFPKDERLVLIDRCADCYTSVYRRVD